MGVWQAAIAEGRNPFGATTGSAVLPVGFPLGTSHPLGIGEPVEQPQEIRKGESFYNVTAGQYAAWMLALQAADREVLEASCTASGLPNAGELIEDLLEAGLLVAMWDSPLQNLPLLESHRLLPVGLGFGNSLEHQDAFVIGQFGLGPRLTVDLRVYLVWGLSTRPISVAEACREVAATYDVDVEPVLGQLAVNLPLLIRHGAALLDEA